MRMYRLAACFCRHRRVVSGGLRKVAARLLVDTPLALRVSRASLKSERVCCCCCNETHVKRPKLGVHVLQTGLRTQPHQPLGALGALIRRSRRGARRRHGRGWCLHEWPRRGSSPRHHWYEGARRPACAAAALEPRDARTHVGLTCACACASTLAAQTLPRPRTPSSSRRTAGARSRSWRPACSARSSSSACSVCGRSTRPPTLDASERRGGQAQPPLTTDAEHLIMDTFTAHEHRRRWV